MNMVGKNTIGGELLRGFVERVENVNEQIKNLGKDKAVIMAEAKQANLIPAGITYIVKKRKMKPSERSEAEALEDMYMHAMGMAADNPLFRAVGLMRTSTSNVKRIFDAAAAAAEETGSPLLLFFDEFDTIAQKRMHDGINPGLEHDHNAMVNSLLARLDAYESFIIAATNKASAIDESVWRRFEIQIEVALPGQFERERILARYLHPFGLPNPQLKALAEACETATPALMRGVCESLKRQIVVGPECGWDMRRDAVIERLLAAILPHPDCGKPRLWAHGIKDHAIKLMSWPLAKASDIIADAPAAVAVADNVVSIAGRA